MITTLHIKNIGIIDDLTIDLNEGLNVLTGETGAGKTLIIDSLAIIAGGRFSKEMIRRGENYSFVELSIYYPDNELAIDGNIIVTREVYANGRNSCKINGRLVTVNELKDVMKKIIDIHGQQDNQLLLDSKYHIKYLDNFIGKDLKEIKEQYMELYNEYKKLKNELQNNYGDEKEKERRLDLLKYQLKEIEQVDLKPKEDEELEEKRNIILNSEKLQVNLIDIDTNLSNQVIDGLSNSIRALEKIENYGEIYKGKLVDLKNIYYEIQELARDFENMREDVCFDEYERNEIEKRLDIIFSLKRKYGNSIEEILKYKENVSKQIYEIENVDEHNEKLRKSLAELEEKMKAQSKLMEEIRKKYAIVLSEKINKELKDLEMFNSVFEINVETIQEFNLNGLNKVEFFICTNIGDESKPLVKIASGGEMSRLMLAIKSVLASTDEVPVLVFDEIDTGISGKAAKAVGEKLKAISKTHQVICITHLAPIAAKGDYNYYITKNIKNEKTVTNIKQLNEEETINEIARIATGEVTEISKKQAIELRKVS